ncbi:MAG TPA: DUF2092 domain-containing protein [Polyangiaceae bacterium]|nr:DUF2092 domain-containing protein [Polyangiaceae bacterium]
MSKWSSGRASVLVFPALVMFPALILSGGPAHAAGQPAGGAPARESAIDPQAKDALTRMSDAFKSLPAFSVHEDITREQVLNGDLKVQKSSSADVIVRRPDRLKASVVGDDDKKRAIFFDGKTVTLYMPTRNYYARMDAPGTIGAAIDTAESRYGLDFPAPDFLRMASGEDFAKGLTAAGEVGKSRVGNTDCEHYAYRSADVDYQLWVETGDKPPLPRKLVITSKKDPTQPEYTAIVTWDLAPTIDDAAFTFRPPEGATEIAFGTPPAGHPKMPRPKPAPAKK